MPQFPGFIGGSAPSQSVIATSERTVNLYVEKVGTQGTQNKTALFPTPGFSAWNPTPTSDVGGRGAITVNNFTMLVMGGGFYSAAVTATLTKLGTVAQDNNPAQIAYNGPTGAQFCIASGSNAYLYNTTSGVFSTVLTGEANQVGMLDEYFLALNQTTGKLRLSDLNDGTTWQSSQFALRSAQPDPWVAFIVNAPDIILLGALTGDVWYDAGTSPFPLAARAGLTIPYGIVAPFSLAQTGGQVYWLTQNKDGAGLVVQMTGYSPQVISTAEVDAAIAGYQRTSTITDAEALVMQIEGHTWYVLRFPTANHTWVYDITTGIWFEAGKWDSAAGDYDVWSPRVHVYAYGKHLTADVSSGTISVMDITTGTELSGEGIRRFRRGPILIQEDRRLPIRRFELLAQPGVGTQTGQGLNPTVMFRSSGDGGQTWSNERAMALGKIGQYGRRVYVNRLASPRMFVPEISMSDPVPLRIVDAYVNNNGAAA